MHNIDLIIKNLDKFISNISKRGVSDELINQIKFLPDLNNSRKEKIKLIQNFEEENNKINSKEMPSLKKQEKILLSERDPNKNDENLRKIQSEIKIFVDEVEKNNSEIKKLDCELSKFESEIKSILERIPNPALSKNDDFEDILIPIGNEDQNLEIRRNGKIREFDFVPRSHEEIGVNLDSMDFVQTAKISGSRFVSFSGKIAKLERALGNFMIDLHTKEHGYELYSIPYLVRNHALYGTGQLPKFSDQSFVCSSGPESFEDKFDLLPEDSYRLIPTAEVPLTNLVREKILKEEAFPIRMVALSPCFRSEIGSGGRDVNGIIRMHQFLKVELVSIVKAEELEKTINANHNESYNLGHVDLIDCELERMTFAASRVLDLLGLPYRIIVLSSEDTGFSAQKTYDIEVWMPAQNKYREISSCSYCGDFQGRRMNSRYKTKSGTKYVHTLNGSALAIGRTIAAIIENYQTKDGDFEIPEVLKKYF